MPQPLSDRSRELLKLALPSMRDHAILLLDPQGVILGWLAGAQQIFGWAPEECVGKNFSVLFTPDDQAKGLPELELEVARRDSLSEDDRWHVRRDGARIWISGTVTAVRDATGAIRGFIKMMRDRTDLRTEADARANQLAQALGAIDRTHRFVETLGHELSNPLTPMKIASHVLRKAAADNPAVLEAADIIAGEVAVLERIAADLVDVARLRHQKLELRLDDFDVRPIVERAVRAAAPAAQEKDLTVELLLPEAPLELVADAVRVQQAVANMLANAVKYTPAGGRVWVKATQENGYTVLRVEDTGIGIEPEVLPRIFELFSQEVRAEQHAPGGLGVGLAIVNQIAQLHGGVAQARSDGQGKGAEFTLRLPRHGPPVAMEDHGATGDPPAMGEN
jgi:PAS domain S-box-containing protein